MAWSQEWAGWQQWRKSKTTSTWPKWNEVKDAERGAWGPLGTWSKERRGWGDESWDQSTGASASEDCWRQSWWGSHGWRTESESADDHEYDWILEAKGSHRFTMLWLHSCYGRPEHVQGYLDNLREQGVVAGVDLRVVAPRAPMRPSEIPDQPGLQWFQYKSEVLSHGGGVQDDANLEQLREQRQRLLRLLDNELRRLPPEGRLIIDGLSQGVSMAVDLLLHIPRNGGDLYQKFRGVIARRGMLQRESLEDVPKGVWLSGFPILAVHGSDDEVAPLRAAWRSYALLSDCGASLRFHTIRGMRHTGYSSEEISLLADFVRTLLHGPRS